ncbi:MAG: CapA family protein [Jiangellaceae bacterium]|nr:CapA family protein [Jiangellaceae bacterium]
MIRPLLLGVTVTALALGGCTGESEPATQSSVPPPVTETPTPTPTPTPEPRTFTVVATGDVLLHERLWTQAERDASGGVHMDFGPQLANIKPVVSAADLAVCHLEVPLADADGPFEGYPTFSGPPLIVAGLAATGYDVCSTASNHTFDQGAAGVIRTLDALDAGGISHAGSARSAKEAEQTTVIDVETADGLVKVALLSYTYGFNGIPYPDGQTFWANEIDEVEILRDASAARQHSAEVVIVSLHWGTEYDHRPNAQQVELAPRLIRSPDIDLLLGHHAHVVQPIENIAGEWVVYGMGNLMANHAEPEGPKAEGLLTRFTFTEDLAAGRFVATAAEYLPLYQTYEFPVEVLAVPAALASADTGTASADRLNTALDRTSKVVGSRGAAAAGLTLLKR